MATMSRFEVAKREMTTLNKSVINYLLSLTLKGALIRDIMQVGGGGISTCVKLSKKLLVKHLSMTGGQKSPNCITSFMNDPYLYTCLCCCQSTLSLAVGKEENLSFVFQNNLLKSGIVPIKISLP